MDILVCIKQVPDTKDIKLDPETNTLKREGVESIVNPFDMYAVETALMLKDEWGGTVRAVTMGPPQAEQALREVVSYGVDEVALFSDRAFAGADTWATAYTLAKGIRKLGDFDLIICGKQAVDGDTAQVGPGLAQQLDLPFITFVRRIVKIELDSRTMVVERLMDDGYDVVETSLPALLTVVKEINELRVPSLKGKMKAKKIDIPIYSAADLEVDPDSVGLTGSYTQVIEVFAPKPRGNRIILEGETEEQVEKLLNGLTKDKVLSVKID
ncbi:MAG: electron transfer flavoprotein subunit beta/FixA family protein [Deltaproteobacteria bacterium]|nr:electron transfer flavoprotein subunit beta/FixA family protein [Deltaproteobacteria bacterium]MBW2050894.1 electron transfer flavoprotein subunit beta/FixA family protein [Deltaproteobacteria bacterium]MBW2139553.1 electron transfer flavoprotein subunit beta/FixA family protein [Deltaproteobacteria bacterium]MBW2322612.1 electron transfer flavoprotein subunit beta/FixA family protein [Deltaproteobacteria bacterium]